MSIFDPVNDYNNGKPKVVIEEQSYSAQSNVNPLSLYLFVKVMLVLGIIAGVIVLVKTILNPLPSHNYGMDYNTANIINGLLLILSYILLLRRNPVGLTLYIVTIIIRFVVTATYTSDMQGAALDGYELTMIAIICAIPLIVMLALLFIPGSRGSAWSIIKAYNNEKSH